MIRRKFQSASRRFLRKFGFALTGAAVIGIFLSVLASRRPSGGDDADIDGEPLARARAFFERLELATYDVRARMLGERSEPSDEVVLLAIDDESLAHARQERVAGVALHPWPRQVVGSIIGQLVSEGAALVMWDSVLDDPSPRACGTEGARVSVDDEALRAILEKYPGKTAMAFSTSRSLARKAPSVRPALIVFLEQHASKEGAQQGVRRLLSERYAAFVIPVGQSVQLWAGVRSEDEGRAFARSWGTVGPPQLREVSSKDLVHQVTATELLISLTAVKVEGLNPARVAEARRVDEPLPALLSERNAYGSVSAWADVDGRVRRYPHLHRVTKDGESHLLPSLPLATAMKRAGTQQLRYADGRLHIGDAYSIPLEETGETLLRWHDSEAKRDGRGPMKRALSVWRVMQNLLESARGLPQRHANDVSDKVVILTDVTEGHAELLATPIGMAVPKAAVMGQAFANLLQSEGIRRVPRRWDFFGTVGLALLGAVLAVALSPVLRSARGAVLYLGAGALAAFAYWSWVKHLFLERQVWMGVALPLVALVSAFGLATVYSYRTDKKVRTFVHSALGRYVSPRAARMLARDLSLIQSERRQLTVYFCGIQGFAAVAEELPVDRLAQMLAEYLSEMSQVVRANDGHVDKYIGDWMIAFWGAPLRTDRHARLACESALQMSEALTRRQPDWEKRFGVRLKFKAALHTGEMVVGDMGSLEQTNYTVVGESVAFAQALERANRRYGTQLLVSEQTVQNAGDGFAFREIDRVRFRGHSPVRLFELWGRKSTITAEQQAHLSEHGAALSAFHERRFDLAASMFEKLSGDRRDPLATIYALRCRALAATPPPEDWDWSTELA